VLYYRGENDQCVKFIVNQDKNCVVFTVYEEV